MSMDVKGVVFVVLIAAVVGIAFSFLRTLMGKSTRGVLHVPQGKNIVPVIVCQEKPLKPFKFSQAFDVVFIANPTTITNQYTGEVLSGPCAIEYRNKPVGFMDHSSRYVHVLSKLGRKNKKLVVSAMVQATDEDGRPIMHLRLPDDKWFLRALK